MTPKDGRPPAFGRVTRPLRAVFFCFFSFAPKEKKSSLLGGKVARGYEKLVKVIGVIFIVVVEVVEVILFGEEVKILVV